MLHADGRIDLSYRTMTARDAIVGVFAASESEAAGADGEPVDLSAADGSAAPAAVVHEAFHHYSLPRAEDLACTVIREFGDRFDFMVWRTRAIVGGDTIELRGEHVPWAMSGAGHPPGALHTPSPFPYGDGEHEASVMGGAAYQDNGDGTFTVLDRGSMQPASGFSYLELYQIGVLAPEDVPPFFLPEHRKRRPRRSGTSGPPGRLDRHPTKARRTWSGGLLHDGQRLGGLRDST